MYDTTIDLHKKIIRLGLLQAGDNVIYASTGASEYAYRHYDAERILAVVEPSPEFDIETWGPANYCGQTVPLFEDFSSVPHKIVRKISAVVHNYAHFQAYDYGEEAEAFRENSFVVFSSFFPSERGFIRETVRKKFRACCVETFGDIVKISK